MQFLTPPLVSVSGSALSVELWALKVGFKINGPKTEFVVSEYSDPLAPPLSVSFYLLASN